MALCRWTFGGERHRYAISSPGKVVEVGTGPMTVGRIINKGTDAIAESGECP